MTTSDSCATSPLGSVLVLAKAPVAGRVKTRLTPPFEPDQAAELAAASLRDTLRATAGLSSRRHVLVLDGSPVGLVPPDWECLAQCRGGLDLRLAAAFAAVADSGPAVLVGMDTPQLRAAQLAAFDPRAFDCCFGPAVDGGFWALGFRNPAMAELTIPGVEMSQPGTGRDQLDRLHAGGLRVQLLPELTDVDTAESARLVAGLAPQTEFAAVHRAMTADTARAVAPVPVPVRVSAR